jgi:hypothetical protein
MCCGGFSIPRRCKAVGRRPFAQRSASNRAMHPMPSGEAASKSNRKGAKTRRGRAIAGYADRAYDPCGASPALASANAGWPDSLSLRLRAFCGSLLHPAAMMKRSDAPHAKRSAQRNAPRGQAQVPRLITPTARAALTQPEPEEGKAARREGRKHPRTGKLTRHSTLCNLRLTASNPLRPLRLSGSWHARHRSQKRAQNRSTMSKNKRLSPRKGLRPFAVKSYAI